MTRTSYSIAAAHRITGRSRTTIAKHVKTGKLSCSVDSNGQKRIEATELIRVYGDDLDFSVEEGSSIAKSKTNNSVNEASAATVQLLQERVEREQVERERERNLLMEQIDHLKEALSKSQEGQNRVALLLENQSGAAADTKRRLNEIEESLVKQQREAHERLKAGSREIERLKRALVESQKKRGLVARLFE